MGQWTPYKTIGAILVGDAGPGKDNMPANLFLTVTCGQAGKLVKGREPEKTGHSTNATIEIEVADGTKVLKTLTTFSDDGGTFTIRVPAPR